MRRQLAESRRAPALHLDRYALAPDLKRTMDYAIIGAQNAHLNRAEPEHLLCAMLEDDGCTAGILLASMGVQLTDAVPPAVRAVRTAVSDADHGQCAARQPRQ